MAYDYDVLVIGAGPGGYVAAIRAAQLGLKAAVVEKDKVGGVCLNMGCIPTKSIIHQAGIYRGRAGLAAMGVAVDTAGFKYENILKTSRSAADTLCKGVAYLLKKNGVEVIAGTGRLASDHEVSARVSGGDQERLISAGAIIAATGSRPKSVAGLQIDGVNILSSDDALMMKELPRRALVAGAGAIGLEFAHIMNAFGAEVHVAEIAENILPLMDGEAADVLKRSLVKRGVKFYTSSKISSYNVTNDGITAVIEPVGASAAGRTELSVDKIFVMTGRAPNTEDIGLDTVGIGVSNGFIDTGDYYQTSVPSIYAIGDIVAASPQLAHVASKAGEIAAERIAGKTPACSRIDPEEVPSVVFCEPPIASLGPTEPQAVARGIPFVKASFPFRGCGKAVVCSEAEGMVKIMADPSTKRLIAAHIAGPGAGELIHELLLARRAGVSLDTVAEMIHAHPTLSEAVMEAARAIDGWAIHV